MDNVFGWVEERVRERERQKSYLLDIVGATHDSLFYI